MNKIDAQSWKADMPDFREKTKAFYNGEMSKGDYKGYSGIYCRSNSQVQCEKSTFYYL